MALDLTTAKQDWLAYDNAVELNVPATTYVNFPTKMKAFKIHPTSSSQLVLVFPHSNMLLSIDATADDGKIIPFRPFQIYSAAELQVECLF